jgi:hypothetical protein
MQIDRQIKRQSTKGSSTLMPVPSDGATCSDRHTGQARRAEGRYTFGHDQQSNRVSAIRPRNVFPDGWTRREVGQSKTDVQIQNRQ